MATRKRAPVPPASSPARITVNGEWYEMAEMTGRDYFFIRRIQGHKMTAEDVDGTLELIGRRVTASSVPDPLDRPIRELLELLRGWLGGTKDAALPPPTATS